GAAQAPGGYGMMPAPGGFGYQAGTPYGPPGSEYGYGFGLGYSPMPYQMAPPGPPPQSIQDRTDAMRTQARGLCTSQTYQTLNLNGRPGVEVQTVAGKTGGKSETDKGAAERRD